MRIGQIIDYSGGFSEFAAHAAEYEAAGLELVSIAEAYSFDAVSQIGFLAARTERMELCTSILQLYSRTPTLTAMTAAGVDHVSGGRFTLGLGASGPQVIEGFHGVPYDAPLGRTREVVEICRAVWRREVVEHAGKHYQIPLGADRGTGLGKPLKLINRPVRERIPISLAALGPKNVAMVAEIAESWQPLFFHPEHAESIWGDALREGLARRPAELGPLDVMLQVTFAVDDPDGSAMQAIRNQLALYIGGMGAKEKNFYNQLACRYGYEAAAREVQELYLSGRKAEAAAAVPEDLARAISLYGTEAEVREQLARFAAAGITTVLLAPLAPTTSKKIDDVRRLVEIRNEILPSPS